MTIQKSEALLLKKQDLRETSLILTFYTRGFGKIQGIVRGVRGAHAEFGGGRFELFALDRIVFYERHRGDIFTITECDLDNYFGRVRASLEKLSYASYLIELLDVMTPLRDHNEYLFDLVLSSLNLLEGGSSERRIARIFEIKLFDALGYMPEFNSCVACGEGALGEIRFSLPEGGILCGKCGARDRSAYSLHSGTVKFINHIRSASLDKTEHVKVAHDVGRELEFLMGKIVDYHAERKLKSLAFLKSLENSTASA